MVYPGASISIPFEAELAEQQPGAAYFSSVRLGGGNMPNLVTWKSAKVTELEIRQNYLGVRHVMKFLY